GAVGAGAAEINGIRDREPGEGGRGDIAPAGNEPRVKDPSPNQARKGGGRGATTQRLQGAALLIMTRSPVTNPYLLVLPGFLLAAFIILWPLYQLGVISLSEVNRFGQLRGFAGFDNYVAVFTDREFLGALWRTFIWTFGIVFGALIVSVPVALVLNEDFYGRSIARVIVMLPWAVSLTMTAIVWRWALNGESGMLNSGLRALRSEEHTSELQSREKPVCRLLLAKK